MSYITGAIYPSSDRPQLGATEEETLPRLRGQEHRRSPRIRQPRHPRTTRPAKNLQPARTRHRRRHPRPPAQPSSNATETPSSRSSAPPSTSTKKKKCVLANCTSSLAPLHPRTRSRRTAHQRQVQPALRHPRCIPRPTAAPHPSTHCRQVRPRARGTRERQRRD